MHNPSQSYVQFVSNSAGKIPRRSEWKRFLKTTFSGCLSRGSCSEDKPVSSFNRWGRVAPQLYAPRVGTDRVPRGCQQVVPQRPRMLDGTLLTSLPSLPHFPQWREGALASNPKGTVTKAGRRATRPPAVPAQGLLPADCSSR